MQLPSTTRFLTVTFGWMHMSVDLYARAGQGSARITTSTIRGNHYSSSVRQGESLKGAGSTVPTYEPYSTTHSQYPRALPPPPLLSKHRRRGTTTTALYCVFVGYCLDFYELVLIRTLRQGKAPRTVSGIQNPFCTEPPPIDTSSTVTFSTPLPSMLLSRHVGMAHQRDTVSMTHQYDSSVRST